MRTGRAVVVTGAGGGMGAALVARFLANGDDVVAADRDALALERLRSACEPAARLRTVAADTATEAGCAAMADVAGRRVDVLVNCAGWFPITPFERLQPDEWRRVLEVNLTGPYLACRAVLPLMKGRGWGRIISYGSASIFDGVPGQSHYVAAKAGLVGFSKCLARELGADGVTVNVVTPGLTPTGPVREHFPPSLLERVRAGRAIGRDATPEDLVGAVLFLASPDADFITGQTLNVDGGAKMP